MEHFRRQLLDELRAELFGPSAGEDEQIAGRPYWRYLCGMLFPTELDTQELGEDDEKESEGIADNQEGSDASIELAYEALPASMGVSFYVAGAPRLICRLEGARYERLPDSADRWQRHSLGSVSEPTIVELAVPPAERELSLEERIWEGRARVCALYRPRGGGHLVTISLVNAQRVGSKKPAKQIECMLFQCRFRITADERVIGEYPSATRYARHPEDDELALMYRDRKTYGVGHGCAATWTSDTSRSGVRELIAEPLPMFEVRGLTNEIKLSAVASRVLSLRWLADSETTRSELTAGFRAFTAAYRAWVDDQERRVASLGPDAEEAATRIVGQQRLALERMEHGIRLLVEPPDPDVPTAFRIAQEAMLRQFLWSRRRRGPRDRGEGEVTVVDPWRLGADEGPQWRPFQLAFQLVVLESLVRHESPDRETLDLLWFPTGGGKTEAYLTLAALEIVLRRLRHGAAGGGTAVLMRYTLRLLTSQQFERSATLISVLETMRRRSPHLRLGDEPIRLGLWVGGATTPNRLDRDTEYAPGAVQLFHDRVLADDPPENPFQLRTCPHCGTRIVPKRRSARQEDYGIHVTSSVFRMFCPDERCVLHDEIPVSVIDEDLLLRRPPTFLIGTIDKFARMVWDARSRVFLGQGSDGALPPSLVIQDELHLITGPLGTIAGLYEAAIDTVIRRRGIVPKYVAATATIQRAREQCRSLYARSASIFPPPGLDIGDSFFSREDYDRPGRTFVGAMGHGLYSSLTSLIQVSSASAAAVCVIPESEPEARDAYWTQIIYHNSRHELGKTTTMLRDDVRSRLAILQPHEQQRREFERVEELSANLKGAAVSEALERLQVGWPAEEVIDAVACTNMISVGVDVSRLGLMIVKGQPKSTSEYIQASSRVGRDERRPPGVVVALYSAARPRDRSHYEGFQSYHQALYRAVEPVTVTPFSPPARARALHAALVLALRHALNWEEPRDAGAFDPANEHVRSVVDALVHRLRRACQEDERDEVERHLHQLEAEWAAEARKMGSPLSFSIERQFRCLLAQFPGDGESATGLWPTLNSMRHVDGEVRIEVRGEERGREI